MKLNYLKSITSEGNRISWTNKSAADLIFSGDIISINAKNEICKNGEKIGQVTGFQVNQNTPQPPMPDVVEPEPETVASTPVVASAPEVIEPEIDTSNNSEVPTGTQENGNNVVDAPASTSSPETSTEVIKPLLNALEDFKVVIRKAEDWDFLTHKEYREEHQAIIQQSLLDIQQSITLELNKDQPNAQLINEARLYLARYFSDLSEDWTSNEHWRNYDAATSIALQILPQENQPEPITEATIHENLTKNVGLMNFVKSTINNQNGWSAEEKLQKIHKSSAWQEMMEDMSDSYQDKLEEYLEWVDEDNLSPQQIEALDLLKDIHGIWWFDIAEKKFDMFQDVGANIGIIIASMVVAWKTGAAIGWTGGALAGWIWVIPWGVLGFLGWALAGWITATAWLSVYNWDTEQLSWKETWPQYSNSVIHLMSR